MSDSLNALLQHVDGVPTVPSGGTTLVNPLAAVRAGNEAAQQVFQTRGLQAQQAIGQILQQSTDASGNVDYQMAHRLAASAGPVVQMGMMSMAKDASGLRGSQIAQAGAMNGLLAMHGMSLMKDPSDTNTNAAFDNLAANGMPADVVARERARVLAMSPADRQNHAYQEGLAHLDQVRQVLGQTTLQNVGPRIAATTLNQPTPGQPGGSVVEGGGGVGLGMNPAEYAQHQQWLLGEVEYPDPADPTKTKKATRATMLQDMHVDPRQVWPGALQGAAPPPAAASGGAPSVTPPPAPKNTTVRPSVPPPPPFIKTEQTTPPFGTGTGASTSAPGTIEAAKLSAEDSAKSGAALIARGDQAPSNKANYANMMSDLDRLGSMPPGAAKQVAIETFLRKATGYGLTMSADQVAAANSFSKLANIAIGQQLAAIGGTDARQDLFMGSSPNLDLSKLGNEQIIHMLQGNEDAIQAKARAWNAYANENGSHTYRQFQDDWNHHFDPRVFQQQYYSPQEVEQLKKSLAREGKGATAKFWEDMDYARANKMIP